VRWLRFLLPCLLLGCGDPPDPTPVPEQDPNAGPPGKHPGKPDPRQPTAQTIAAVDALTQPLEVGVFMDGSGRGKDDAIAYFEALVAARDDVQLVKLEAGSGLTSRFAGSRNRGPQGGGGQGAPRVRAVRR
jgi:hypothetical protein